MTMFSRLRKHEAKGLTINVAVTGAGLIGHGMVRQVDITPGMRTALLIARHPERAIDAYIKAGHNRSDIVVSDKLDELQRAIDAGQPAVTRQVKFIRDLQRLDAVVEATGAVEYGAKVALCAIEGGKHVIMMNAETDATVGCALKKLADEAGVVYTNSDGDQPGALMRLFEYVRGIGFEVVAALNCKGFMDIYATPDTIRPWAKKQRTSLAMTTAFTDGTKMNIENAVLANATGLLPEIRGMHGIKTDMPTALEDCMKVFQSRGVVDYTLGGSFGGGVFVIGYSDNTDMVQPMMRYFKMGDGPYYLFYRPWHLCHFETPLSIAEAVLDHEPTITPLGSPMVEVIAIAKRDLKAGEILDGIGGYTTYGQIDRIENTDNLLPVGLTDGVRLTRSVCKGEPVPINAVELSSESTLMQLRQQQASLNRAMVA